MVTVTYGNREGLLSQVLRSAMRSSLIDEVVVVSNNAVLSEQFREDILRKKVRLIELTENFGSAFGFSEGIKAFLKGRSEYMLLLDDDNVLCPEALEKLYAAASQANNRSLSSANLAYRPDHQPWVRQGKSVKDAYPANGAFLDFTLPLFLQRVGRRLGKKQQNDKVRSGKFHVPYAPYGGLLLDRKLVAAIGFPREDFYLYCDDTEYTSRITAFNIPIVLDTSAQVEDIDISWSSQKEQSNSFQRILTAGRDSQVYYATRNRVFFERGRNVGADRFKHNANMILFLCICAIYSMRLLAFQRFKLILHAVCDGCTGKMGVVDRFKLT